MNARKIFKNCLTLSAEEAGDFVKKEYHKLRAMRCWLCAGYKYLVYLILSNLLKLKFWILSDYYGRLAVQARYLYRSSQLFRDRWQQMGLDYAEQSFEDDLGGIGRHFFWKAKQSPWTIKKEIILDSILERPARPYALSDSGE